MSKVRSLSDSQIYSLERSEEDILESHQLAIRQEKNQNDALQSGLASESKEVCEIGH